MATALTLPVWLTAAYPDGGQIAQAATKKPTKKAKAVINKIKAIDSKKTNYIAKVRAANNAYKKLSAKDRKLVSNYKTLKKHMTKIAPLEKKITTLNTQVAKITNKNYTTTAPKAQKTYKAMNSITKAAVPAATVKKLNQYTTSATARAQFKSVAKLLATADEDGNVEVEVGDSTNGIVDEGGEFNESKTELAKQLNTFLPTYKSLDTFQKSLFTDDENQLIQAYLADEAKISGTVALINAYEKLQPTANTYAAKAFEVALLFNDFIGDFESESPDEYFDSTIYSAIEAIAEKNEEPIAKINEFQDAVNEMKKDLRLDTIYEAEQKYNELNAPANKFNLTKYVDKDLLKTYQEYAKVPAVLKTISKALPYPDVTAESPIPSAQELNKVKDAQAAFKSLAKDQQAFTLALANDGVDTSSGYDLDIDQAIENLPYTQEEADVKAAEKLDNSYTKAYNASDLEGMIATSISFGSALPNVQKYSLFGEEIQTVNETYAEQIEDIKEFEQRLKKLNTLEGLTEADTDEVLSELEDLEEAYDTLAQKKQDNPGKPAAIDMLSKATVKDYELYMTMPALIRAGIVLALDLEKKPYDPDTAELRVEEKDFKYNTNDEQRIVDFAKTFNKLTEPQKTLVAMTIELDRVQDTTPIARIWGQEASLVAQAQKLDAQILKLNTGSKKFAAEVKKVYNDYKSAPPKVKKYVINQERLHWFNGLVSKKSGNYPQAIANKFKKYVSKLNADSAITVDKTDDPDESTPVMTAVTYYDTMIEHDTSTQSIIEKSIMTKYNKYLNAYNTYHLLLASDLVSPDTQDIKNIQQAIALYDKLEVGPRKALMNTIDGAHTDIAKILSKAADIKTATTIDKDYQKLKPSSPTYKVDMIKIYTTYANASETVRKFVAAKDDLEKVKSDYAAEYEAAMAFKGEVDALTSSSNMGDVNDLKEYYEANIESDEIIRAFIPEKTNEEFEKFMYLIDVQDVARYNYFYNYWCAEDDILSYDYLYVSLTQEDLVKVFKKYNKMDAEQKGILAVTRKKTEIEEANPGACYLPGKDEASQKAEKNVIRDTSFLASAKYVDEANAIDKMYEALKPKDKNYLQSVMEVVNAYENANSYAQPFVKHAEDILKLKEKYKADFDALQEMEKIIKSLSADSQIAPQPMDDYIEDAEGNIIGAASVNKAYDAYNRLPEYVQQVIADDLKKKYSQFIPLLDIQVPALRDEAQTADPASDRPTGFTPYTPKEITRIKDALATYKKLGTLQKTIAKKDDTLNNGEEPIGTKEALETYIDQEAYYKEAATMDAAYKKFVDKYGTEPYIDANPKNNRPPLVAKEAATYANELKKLVLAYDKLSNNAVWYLQNDEGLAAQKEDFDAAYEAVYEFEQAVADIDSKSTLDDIAALKDIYDDFSDYQKAWIDSKVLTQYKKYEPIVTIAENLEKLPPFALDDDEADPDNFDDEESKALKQALDLYNKLSPEAKAILDAEDLENAEYLTDAYDVNEAEKTDKLISNVKSGSTFFKSYVNARKSYDALTKKQKQYLKQKADLKKYDKAVDKVKYSYSFYGDAEISYKDNDSYNPYEMIIMYEELIDYLDENQAGQSKDTREDYLKDVADMVNLRNALNKSVKINGVSLKPLVAADTKKQARYHYYYTLFDMKHQLKKFNEAFPK